MSRTEGIFIGVLLIGLGACGSEEDAAQVEDGAEDTAEDSLEGGSSLVWVHSGKCVDASGGVPQGNAFTNAIQWPCSGRANQRLVISRGQQNAVVRLAGTNKCLDVSGGSRSNGARVLFYNCHGGGNQRWSMVSRGPSGYSLVNYASGRCLDVNGGSQADGARLIIWNCSGRANQSFRLR